MEEKTAKKIDEAFFLESSRFLISEGALRDLLTALFIEVPESLLYQDISEAEKKEALVRVRKKLDELMGMVKRGRFDFHKCGSWAEETELPLECLMAELICLGYSVGQLKHIIRTRVRQDRGRGHLSTVEVLEMAVDAGSEICFERMLESL